MDNFTEIKAMNTEQVAHRLNIRERTVRRLINEGELIAYKIGKEWRIDEPDLKSYITKQKKKRIWNTKQA